MMLALKQNKKLSTSCVKVIGVTVRCGNISISEVWDALHDFQKQYFTEGQRWLHHPIDQEKIKNIEIPSTVYYIEPTKQLNSVFQHASLLEKIYYIDMIGTGIAKGGRSAFWDVIAYREFCNALAVRGIINPSWTMDERGAFKEPIRRIHVLQKDFLDDPEIAQGLHVSYSKNTPLDKVLYVCSEEFLSLALKHCAPGVTLIIDGHWEHEKRSRHGVWDNADASVIAASLQKLSNMYPDTIRYIRLWGCSSGQIAAMDGLNIDAAKLIFKDQYVPSFHSKDMAAFRHRAVYYSMDGENPFDANSLAGKIMHNVPSLERITAVPSYGYPFPVQEKPHYNIGSDASEWRGGHYWVSHKDSHYPSWYKKLHHLKSLTVMRYTSDVTLQSWPTKLGENLTAKLSDYNLFSKGSVSLSTRSATPVGEEDVARSVSLRGV